MRITFKFGDDDIDHWYDDFTCAPRIGDTVSFGGEWYLVNEVRWVLDAAAPGMGKGYVAVFADRNEEESINNEVHT